MSAVLDTNILSEMMRILPDPAVAGWILDYPSTELYFSSVGEAELRYGAATMPAGKRRDAFARTIERILVEDFSNRILPFDHPAAREYADIAATRKAAGRPILWADCQIAAIARSRDMAVATSNVRDRGCRCRDHQSLDGNVTFAVPNPPQPVNLPRIPDHLPRHRLDVHQITQNSLAAVSQCTAHGRP